MMVFYSANVSYRPLPYVTKPAGPATALEPEMRFIIADRLTMWSPEMTAAFRGAGYAAARLAETGPIVFARARGFDPKPRAADRAVRLGLFEVTPVRAAMRFDQGYGQLLYTPDYARRFFADVARAARGQFGDRFVFVRKIKRAPGPHNLADPDLAGLGVEVVTREPDDSLWRVLEDVDLVLCMPFTSVAYVADSHGIPAAYYDPGGTAEPSPLGGRAALLRGPDALARWLAAPGRPVRGHDAVRAASQVLAAALNGRPPAARAEESAIRLERNVIHS
jgi:polysaccharide biosynthesis PFTS motif protein